MASQVSAANLGGVTDPRLNTEADAIGSKEYDPNTGIEHHSRPAPSKLYDPSVTFEEYYYYSQQERAYERNIVAKPNAAGSFWTVAVGRIYSKKEREAEIAVRTGSTASQGGAKQRELGSSSPFAVISDEEWHTAARAARTATWGAVFYLITTDVLGPFSVPYAFSQLGYGPAVALYTVFAVFAWYGAWQLWQQFLGLDSARYPILGYGDLAYRIYGPLARHGVNILQILQFFLNVTILIVSSGQSFAQLASGPSGLGCLPFIVAELIFAILGLLLGQIRTLQRFSHLANLAIWLNVFVIFMTMGIVSSSGPNYQAALLAKQVQAIGEPIYKTAGVPPGKDLVDNINGLMQAVYSYGGATLYLNLMAEMRRPMDFWKALLIGDMFIYLCYLIFGLVVYSYQGQASFNPAYQGINPYAWQTVGNVFGLITALIAAVLYGNIGIKVLYANVGRELLNAPALESRNGKLLWVFLVPIYWAFAFIIAGAVPQVSGLSAFVGAAMILQFSYTFPPLLMVGFNCLKDSIPADGAFDPATGQSRIPDRGFARVWRGFKVQLFRNMWDVFWGLGAATTAVLGIYSAGVSMHDFFEGNPVTPFTWISPAGSGCYIPPDPAAA